jgi:8-oxo-dGTP diphosphatase
MKRVKYWAAQAAADVEFQPNEEVDRLDWLPVPRALVRLSRQTDVELLAAFATLPVDTVPIILLRHADAVSRKQWDGPDEDRPLTPAGEAEALDLAPLLAAYGDSTLVTSPATRCVETLEPAAKHAGLDAVREPALAEDADPEASQAWLRHVLKAQRPMIACTHRPVVPGLLGESPLGLVIRAGRRALAPGEAWVLHTRDESVVAIDRLRP